MGIMQTRKIRQDELFTSGPLCDLIPEDHILKQVERIIDLSWFHDAVRHCYCQVNGRPSVDPEAALRLMLAGFFQGITSDRQLMREAQVNVAIRWFAGYTLTDRLPDASSFTRIRQRWGEALFREVFERSVRQCMDAGLVNASTVHVDATLIRADVSWDSLVTRHADQTLEENTADRDKDEGGPQGPPKQKPGRPRTKAPKKKKYSPTDPEATMATSCKQYHLEPTYKQHTAVEDRSGVIVDVCVTTGETSEGQHLPGQLDRIEQTTGTTIETVTCDSGYAHTSNYAVLEEKNINAIIPPPKASLRKKSNQKIPACRFKYNQQKDIVICPTGKRLERKGRNSNDTGHYYRARACNCKQCPMRQRCIPTKSAMRTILLIDGYSALLRARRRKQRGWDAPSKELYARHRWHVKGVHGRSKTQHGLNRAIRRGRANVATQSYLTAATMNLKKLAQALLYAILGMIAPVGDLIARSDCMIIRQEMNSPISAVEG
jgi:transposase